MPAQLLMSDKQMKVAGGLPLAGLGSNSIHDESPKMMPGKKFVPSLDFIKL